MADQPTDNTQPPADPNLSPRRPIEVKNDDAVGGQVGPTALPPPPHSGTHEAHSGSPAAPGQVTSGSAVVTNGGGKKRGMKRLAALLAVIVLLVAGWFVYQQFIKKDAAAPVTANKEIPLLKVGILDADYGSLYPDMAPTGYAILINSQMFEGLVRYENKSKIVPDLASTWTNPDDKTWLFTLKPNIKFHDGNTLAPEDVKYSIDTVIAKNTDMTELFAATIESVDVVGKNQVKITTKEPDPTLLNKLTFLYVIDANLPKGDEPSQAGTGPYQIKPGTKPSATDVQMVAFNDYHGGQPKTQALNFGTSKEAPALVKDFQDHKYNIAGPVPIDDAKKAPGAYKFISNEPNVNYLGFNTVKPGPLQNKMVREAIRYAVNGKAIGESTGNPVTPISQVIPPSIPGYNPAIKPYKQDTEKAKKLLAEAGYPNGLTIRYSVSADSHAVEQVVNDLKKAGITVTVDSHDDFDEFIEYFNTGQAEMYNINYTSDTLDGYDIDSTVFTGANYNNPKFTALLDQIATTTDPAKRLKLLQEAATIVNEDVAAVPLFSEDAIWLMDQDYAIKQDMPSAFISVYFYKVQLK